jgi:hypothetical protein
VTDSTLTVAAQLSDLGQVSCSLSFKMEAMMSSCCIVCVWLKGDNASKMLSLLSGT